MSRRAQVVTRRIVLVEDHRETTSLVSQILKDMGHKVQVSGPLAEAIKACRATAFDLVFCNIGLPDGSGLDLPGAAKSAHPNTTWIATTTDGYSHDLAKARAKGFDDLVLKPMFVEAIHRYLR